jgi:hypothetical protein
MPTVTDYHDQPLAVGDRVSGQYGEADGAGDTVDYTGRVTRIDPPHPGSHYRHITVLRDDTHAEHETFSDAVVVLTGPVQVDPHGCACTECLTGQYVPLDRARPEHIAALLTGEMSDATGEKFTLAVVTPDYLSGREDCTVTVTAEYCGRSWTWTRPAS